MVLVSFFFFLSNVRNFKYQNETKLENQWVRIYMHVQTSEQREQAPLNKQNKGNMLPEQR
jgi:hypothetical protein